MHVHQVSQAQSGRHASRQRLNPLLRLPIATQLTIGFLLAALIAAVGAGTAGARQNQTLSQEAAFYRSLSDNNTTLTTGTYYLEITQLALQSVVDDVSGPIVSAENLQTDTVALNNDIALVDHITQTNVTPGLDQQFPSVQSLISSQAHADAVRNFAIYSASANRAWQVYRNAVNDVQNLAHSGAATDLTNANQLVKSQAEPLDAEATSALRAIIRFNSQLGVRIQTESASQSQSQILLTGLAAVLGFIFILMVGIFISNGIVRRLGQLQRVALAIDGGDVEQRVPVIGRDEIATVARSVNGMLDTIVGLLEETRRQRDALTSAADRLFADMRVVGAGDLRVNAPVSNDPIGMLGNAFNLTIGRFRRFVLRTQGITDQLEVIARRLAGRTQHYHQAVSPGAPSQSRPGSSSVGPVTNSREVPEGTDTLNQSIFQARSVVTLLASEGKLAQLRQVLEVAEEVFLSARRLRQLTAGFSEARNRGTLDRLARLQEQEIGRLEGTLQQLGTMSYMLQRQMATELRDLNHTLDQIEQSISTVVNTRTAQAFPQGRESQVLQLATNYSREVHEITQELYLLTQDLRGGVVPFRTDGETMDFPVDRALSRAEP